MMEKYNVVTTDLKAGGGEYPAQDGFGWTNGVYLALDNWLQKQKLSSE
jgi:alpha,alpha-trehalase